jgi:hypothetical protein
VLERAKRTAQIVTKVLSRLKRLLDALFYIFILQNNIPLLMQNYLLNMVFFYNLGQYI